MKKYFPVFLFITIIAIASVTLMMPSYIFANGDTYNHSLTVGKAGESTDIRFWGSGYTGYYKFIRLYNDKTGDQIDNLFAADNNTPWDITLSKNLAAGNYHYDLIISEDYDGWASPYGLFVYPVGDIQLNVSYYFTIASKKVSQAPVWVRPMPMTCYRVWINEDNDFQFLFWYPYKDNNWVRIYDMEGNLILEIDIQYSNPNLIIDLPDGNYTVKTFHNDINVPLQEFVIGKP